MTLLDLSTTSVDAFLYGFFGAIGGAFVTWIAAKHLLAKPWRELVALVRHHNATQDRLADAHVEQAEHWATIAARLAPKDEP